MGGRGERSTRKTPDDNGPRLYIIRGLTPAVTSRIRPCANCLETRHRRKAYNANRRGEGYPTAVVNSKEDIKTNKKRTRADDDVRVYIRRTKGQPCFQKESKCGKMVKRLYNGHSAISLSAAAGFLPRGDAERRRARSDTPLAAWLYYETISLARYTHTQDGRDDAGHVV